MIVRTKDLMRKTETTMFGLTPEVKAENVKAMSGIYVDDYLTTRVAESREDAMEYDRRDDPVPTDLPVQPCLATSLGGI